MEKYNPKIQKELVQIYLQKFWPKWRRELFGELYRTFHPSTYEESFSTPTDNFIDMLETLEDKAVQEGVKLGLINPDTFNSFPRLDGELIIDEGANLDWVHGMLLYSVIYDLVMDFRCYQGVNGIDPNCEGKYMNDFNCLKQVYEKLYDYMLMLEDFNIPVGELIGQEKLKRIPLVDLPVEQECSDHKHSWERIDRETEECRGRGGCGLLRTNPLEPNQVWRGTDGVNDEETEVADTLYGVDNNQGFDEDDVIQDYQDPNELLQEALEDDPEVKYLLDNIDLVKVMKGPDAKLLSDYVEGLREWGRYNMIMTDLSPFLTDPETVLKGELSSEIMQWATENESWPPNYEEFFNQQEDPLPYLWAMRQKIRDAMTRLTMRSMEQTGEPMEMDNVNKVFRELARRIYVFVLRGPHLKMAQDRKRRLDEADELNPPVQIGDVIELLHLEDPYSPIPLLTKGIVVGFDKDPWEDRLLVRWIIDPDGPEFQNMPLYPSIDAYRLVRSEELLEESTILNEEEQTQIINYKSIGQQEYRNKYNGKYTRYVFFNSPSVKYKDPAAQIIVFEGPKGRVIFDSIYVNLTSNRNAFSVKYDNDTRDALDPLLNYEPAVSNCLGKVAADKNWEPGPPYWRWNLQKTIQSILDVMYSEYKAPDGFPTPYHIKNGFINVPGTDADGTSYGWSILNFFLTNPNVRRILLGEYEKHLIDNNLGCNFNIKEFTNWVHLNRETLFGFNQPIFKKMVEKNQRGWAGGQKSEAIVAPLLEKMLGKGWKAIYSGEPGIIKDVLKGIDITLANPSTQEELTFQAKPLVSKMEKREGMLGTEWWLMSSGLKQYSPEEVSHFVFGPHEGEIYAFKNQDVEIKYEGNNSYMVFNSPPLNPETINESVYKSFWN